MADGHTDINCTISIKMFNGVETSNEADISSYTESSLIRSINYTKVIGGLVLPRTETGISKDIQFDFTTNDLKFENLFGGSGGGTITYVTNTGVFQVGDTIVEATTKATAVIVSIDGNVLTVNNINGVFNNGESILEDIETNPAIGDDIVVVLDTKTPQTDWDIFNLFKISLLFNNTTDVHKRIFYNAYITEYKSMIVDGVLEGSIKFTLPLKNINGDSNFYIYETDSDNDSVMGYII